MKLLAFLFFFGNSWFSQANTSHEGPVVQPKSTTAKPAALAHATSVINPKDTIVLKLKNKNKMLLISQNGDLTSFLDVDLNGVVRKLDSSRGGDGTVKLNDSTIKLRPRTWRIVGSSNLTYVEVNNGLGRKTYRVDSTVKEYKEWQSKRNSFRTTTTFDIDFGLNSYFENGGQVNSAAPYVLDNLNSRYVALRWLQKTRLGGKESPNYFLWGLELSWYNFKYAKKLRIEQDYATGALSWNGPAVGEQGYEDSKLTVAFLNVPLMYYFQQKKGLRFGIGGYFGYKLDEYNKVTQGGKVIRGGEGDFNLNAIQYGVRGQIGWRGVDLFCNYNLIPLFKKDLGPNLTPISFGISL